MKNSIILKCANCGCEDDIYYKEGEETLFCRRCSHRTVVATGKDDLIVCPYCGRFRDRTAYQCRWCEATMPDNSYEKPSKRAYEKYNKVAELTEEMMGPNNIKLQPYGLKVDKPWKLY